MKKLIFLLGVAVGFLMGSKIGHEPYAKVEKKVKEFTDRPELQDAMKKAKSAAQEQVDHFSEKMSDKLPGSDSADARRNNPPGGTSILQQSGAAPSR